MTNNISFKSNIKIVSNSEFDTILKEQKPKNIQMCEKPVIGINTGTRGLACCIGVGLNNGKKDTAIHYPHKEAIPVETWLMEVVEKLKTNEKIHGLITGGYSRDCGEYSHISKLLDKLGVKYSAIYGRMNGWKIGTAGTEFFHSIKDDAYYITTYPNDNVNSISKFLKLFSVVKIQEGDKLFLHGKEISSSDLNFAQKVERIRRMLKNGAKRIFC